MLDFLFDENEDHGIIEFLIFVTLTIIGYIIDSNWIIIPCALFALHGLGRCMLYMK